jgi:hypothetical protein
MLNFLKQGSKESSQPLVLTLLAEYLNLDKCSVSSCLELEEGQSCHTGVFQGLTKGMPLNKCHM